MIEKKKSRINKSVKDTGIKSMSAKKAWLLIQKKWKTELTGYWE